MNAGRFFAAPAPVDDAMLWKELRLLLAQHESGTEAPAPEPPPSSEAPAGDDHRPRTPLRCRLGRHRMQYAGIMVGRRLERCVRCGICRPR